MLITLANENWTPAARAVPALGDGALHAWHVDLDDPGWDAGAMRGTLDSTEIERCMRLRTAELQRRFVVRRGVLRTLLGGYAGSPPGEVRLVTQLHGKPALPPDDNAHGLHFNLADCGGRALYTFTSIGPVGVDIEALAPLLDMERVARHWFSPAEQEALAGLPEHERVRGFYLAWTRKEALVKAEGTGITMPLDQFSVGLVPGEPARLLHTTLPALHAFELFDIPCADGYVAAGALRGHTR
jgi:4'-phosphopantetheinyl transferase